MHQEKPQLCQRYQAIRAQCLGGLLDIMAAALSILPNVMLEPSEQTRLIEFARLGKAVARAMNQTGEHFMRQFQKSREEAIARTIDASPVAAALIEWFEERCHQRTQILPVKTIFAAVEHYKPMNTNAWPHSAKGFADALRRAAPALRYMGIEARCLGKRGSYVEWKIEAITA
ncbi:MAG: hypothetical protein GY782_07890 [Gammaproteobacteria bacterium]|nr:hypothetical protein [Gammaproteobacteria bacterium]